MNIPPGYQAISANEECRRGDLIVTDNKTYPAEECQIGCSAGHLSGDFEERVYRLIPVASTLGNYKDAQMEKKEKEPNIADKANVLVCGDRNTSYGNPSDDFARVAKTWSGLLSSKLKSDITAQEAIIMMIALKLCREVHKPKEDTRIDMVGYCLCLDWATTGVQP